MTTPTKWSGWFFPARLHLEIDVLVRMAAGVEAVPARGAGGVIGAVAHEMPAGAALDGIGSIQRHGAEVMVGQLSVAQVAGEEIAAGGAAVAEDVDKRSVVDAPPLCVHT